MRAALAAAGIEWRHYYPRPAAAQPALGALRCAPGTFREAERRCAEVVSIPNRASLEPDAIREIARVVREAAGRGSGSDR
jgi:dTDP-4-amino-4,6-dideoxygalactose transaminase